jgi:5-methylcytosine-specific restriction endonuclease McrA
MTLSIEKQREYNRLKMRRLRANNKDRYNETRRKWLDANKKKIKIQQIEWDRNNPQRRKEIWRRWYQKNIDRQREKGRINRTNNIDRYREYSVAYNRENLGRLAAIARNRRARQRQNGGTHTVDEVRQILKEQRSHCAYCRSKVGEYHVDHIVPLAKGGGNDRRNLQILCVACNKHKAARDPIEFMQSQGRLL